MTRKLPEHSFDLIHVVIRREELDAYRAHHSSEPNMYQTEQERMIADHIRQMGPSVCLETEALAARQEVHGAIYLIPTRVRN